MEKRIKRVQFRLYDEEVDIAEQMEKEYQWTSNHLAKFVFLNMQEPQSKEDRNHLKEMNRQVGAIGNNVNQIARKINATDMFLPSEKEELMTLLKEIRNNTRILAEKKPLEDDVEDITYKLKANR
ncbi:MobC family plasmid mobilization relaxosome protein [Niallia sp. MER 6]|uniref:MobC family plasmid mobilization relaxosome protein n=1 Tax=Niallia sp. MER 6 TaxID=2939567 RepID=UPI002040C6C2|nr:MobC family plasmid mobilization relaxosome protein [Niallia sp. MER 6]MCM3034133.1 MobC family plasmid mobilization relaxosome protein [Niallia sp. MER 6]